MSETQTITNTTTQPELPSPADIFPKPVQALGTGHDVAAVFAHQKFIASRPQELNTSRSSFDSPSPQTPQAEYIPGKHAAETILPEKRTSLVAYMGRRVLQKLGIQR